MTKFPADEMSCNRVKNMSSLWEVIFVALKKSGLAFEIYSGKKEWKVMDLFTRKERKTWLTL